MRKSPLSALVTGLIVVPASIGLASASQAASPQVPDSAGLLFSGNAYGTYVTAGGKVVAGKSALSTGCSSAAGSGQGTGVAGVDVPNAVSTGLITSAVTTGTTSGGVQDKNIATVDDANVLSGLITATALKTVSITSHDVTGFQVRGAGTMFTGLVVNSQAISSHPAPNTRISLPGVGRVIVNEQSSAVSADGGTLTVNGLHIFVTHTGADVAKGTEIIVSHATSAIMANKAGGLDGEAYGTWAYSPKNTLSGRTARVFVGCGGTDGQVVTNTVAGVDDSPVITTGAVTDTAKGTITAVTASTETTSTTSGINLLDGLVTADSAVADASASITGQVTTLSDSGSRFSNLVVNGQTIADDVPANTKIVVGNITIWVHHVLKTDYSIEVRMIDVVVTGTNPYGLDKGTHILVSVTNGMAF